MVGNYECHELLICLPYLWLMLHLANVSLNFIRYAVKFELLTSWIIHWSTGIPSLLSAVLPWFSLSLSRLFGGIVCQLAVLVCIDGHSQNHIIIHQVLQPWIAQFQLSFTAAVMNYTRCIWILSTFSHSYQSVDHWLAGASLDDCHQLYHVSHLLPPGSDLWLHCDAHCVRLRCPRIHFWHFQFCLHLHLWGKLWCHSLPTCSFTSLLVLVVLSNLSMSWGAVYNSC